jgi:CRISPR-associated protein Cas2
VRLWVVAYDIADNRRRRQLAACLGKQLERVQESVFEGWLTQHESRVLMEEAANLLYLTDDRLRAYPLAVKKSDRYKAYGQQRTTEKLSEFWIIG